MKLRLIVVCAAVLGCGDDVTNNNMSMDLTVVTEPPDLAIGHCQAAPIGNFSPMFKPPTGAHQNRCTAAQITAGVTAIFGGTFNAFKAANSDCALCMVTDSAAAMLGPLVNIQSVGIIDGNRDGCVALLTGDSSSTSCAAKIQAQFECGVASCGPNCPIMNSADLADFNTCAGQAFNGGPCASFVTNCQTSATVDGGGAPDSCFLGGQGAQVWFSDLITLFCGP